MNMRNRGFSMYFVLILGLLLVVVWTSMLNVRQSEYTRGELVSSLEAGEVAAVSIRPNRETPTGEAQIVLSDGQHRVLYVTDVREIEELVSSYGLNPQVEKVEEENWFLTSVFPVLLAVIVMVFFFVMMNNQNAGGSNKMMNFGKSRARLSVGDGKITLKDVAGLKEEKEELEEIVEFLPSLPEWGQGSPRVFCWRARRVRVRRFWQRP